MLSRWTCVATVLAASLCAVAAKAQTGGDGRLPDQIFNRMVLIHTEGNDDIFVDMPGHCDLGSVSISHDDKWIAFDAMTVGRSSARETWLVDMDGKGLRKVANGGTPRWSPDDKQLLLTRMARKPLEGVILDIVLCEVESGETKEICAGRFPDWSPDGKQIAFSRDDIQRGKSEKSALPMLFVAQADGSDVKERGLGNWPSWSPDGKKIACCVQEEGRLPSIWLLDMETGKRKRIGFGYYRAQWAGDGKSLVTNAAWKSEEGRPLRAPARFRIDRPGQPEFFCKDYHNPWSPCVSRNGKTMVLIVDSQKQQASVENEP